MAAKEGLTKGSNLVISTLCVAILALSASMLLLFALVIWLSELINSLTLSLLLTGVSLAIASWVTYKLTLSSPLKQLREEYKHAMTIISLFRHAYHCTVNRLSQILSLFT